MVSFFCPPPFMSGSGAPFPVIMGTNTSVSGQVKNASVSLPSGIQADDLLLIFASVQASNSDVNPPSGWTKVYDYRQSDSTTGVTTVLFLRVANGSEGASASFNISNERYSAHNSYRISGASGNIVTNSVLAGGSNANPNPPLVTSPWGSKNTLWIATFGARQGDNITVNDVPIGYTNTLDIASTGGNVAGGRVRMTSVSKGLKASAEDPSAFRISAARDWSATTVGIEPG